MCYANGIGPVIKKENKEKVREVLNKVDIISLRDANSYDEIKRMGVCMDRVKITADPALTIDAIGGEQARDLLKKREFPKTSIFLEFPFAVGVHANRLLESIGTRH